MARRRSFTSQFYRAATISDNISAIASETRDGLLAAHATSPSVARSAAAGSGGGSGSKTQVDV
jgi:hypothetical protein